MKDVSEEWRSNEMVNYFSIIIQVSVNISG